jgi:AcrR family transcriptional regulator
MTGSAATRTAWVERVTERSPSVQRSRLRSAEQAKVVVDAARRLIETKGSAFTAQELVKEAGVALQTFYRHFGGKDQLLLAVFEDIMGEQAARMEGAALDEPDPVARLRVSITSALESLRSEDGRARARFITAEHWRLHQLFPDEMALANQRFADVVERDLRDAADAGALHPADPHEDAWLVMKLVMSVYHHYAFATACEPLDDIAGRLWTFCLAAFGGAPELAPTPAAHVTE